MKVVLRSSSLLFFLVSLLLGLPVRRRNRSADNRQPTVAGMGVASAELRKRPASAVLNPLATSANSSTGTYDRC